jgi:hypothetical protein
MVVSSSIRSDKQQLVPSDQTSEETLDDPDPLDTLPPIADEARVAASETQQLEQFGSLHLLDRRDWIWFLCLGSEKGRAWRAEGG